MSTPPPPPPLPDPKHHHHPQPPPPPPPTAQNGNHRRTLISHFTGVNSPFSTASAGPPHSPSFAPFAAPPNQHPSSLACARPRVVYWPERLEGLAFRRGSCWHHVPPSRAAGRRHVGRCLARPPGSIPQRTLPSDASLARPPAGKKRGSRSYIRKRFNAKTECWL